MRRHRKFLSLLCQAALLLASTVVLAQSQPVTETAQSARKKLVEFWTNNLRNAEVVVRKNAARQLAKLRAREATEALVDAARDSSPEVRALAVRALGIVGDKQVLPFLKEQLNRDLDQIVRSNARQAINLIIQKAAAEEQKAAND